MNILVGKARYKRARSCNTLVAISMSFTVMHNGFKNKLSGYGFKRVKGALRTAKIEAAAAVAAVMTEHFWQVIQLHQHTNQLLYCRILSSSSKLFALAAYASLSRSNNSIFFLFVYIVSL
jgi:hypothetical protein